jgi:hypothetical protein
LRICAQKDAQEAVSTHWRKTPMICSSLRGSPEP